MKTTKMTKNNAQALFLKQYNESNREPFNSDLFYRSDDKLADIMKKLILSCQRDNYFTIRIDNFTVVKDYSEIMRILREHEQERIDRKKTKTKPLPNKYDTAPLADSDIFLLIIDYFIQINDGVKNPSDTMRVIVELPKIVDKYYYRLNGKLYSAIYQVVDGSTYNNSAFSSKVPSNTAATIFMPIVVYKISRQLNDYQLGPIEACLYSIKVFNTICCAMEYILAKYGLQGTFDFLEIPYIVILKQAPTGGFYNDGNHYIFERNNIFIIVPKGIFDNDAVTQSLIATLDIHISKEKPIVDESHPKEKKVTREDLYSRNYWLASLSIQFNRKLSIERGLSMLDSFENIYDMYTKEDIHLPLEKKENVYCIVRWIMREYGTLRQKNIVDVATKKLRREAYIASMYVSKIVKAIYLASDYQRNLKISQIKRFIYTAPDYLINRLSKDSLVCFRSNSNDIDSITALKYSYKGESGLGETKGAIPAIFKQLDQSSLGRTDPDSSSNTEPGITGILCPMTKLYGNYFTDYKEPDRWNKDFNDLADMYIKTKSAISLIKDNEELTSESINKLNELEECLSLQKTAISIIKDVDDSTEYEEGMCITID